MKNKVLALSLVILLSFVSLGVVSAHGDEGTEFYDSHHDEMHNSMMGRDYGSSMFGWMYGMSALGWTLSALLIIALVLLIIWLIKQMGK